MNNTTLFSIVLAVVCAAIFLVLRESKQDRERREREELMKRFDDADKPNQRGI